MNRTLKNLPIVIVLLATAAWPVAPSAAQGFSSVSAGVAASTAEVGQVPVPAGHVPAAAPAFPAPVPEGPRMASLGFSSVSGVSTSIPTAAAPSGGGASAAGSNAFELADRVLVDKGDRRLYLLRQDRVIAEYPVKLGLNPYGHKQREGDFRTPEGKYQLVRRNPQSEFFLSIQVSYPNREDAAVAKENGHAPGGLIMIHGQPNVPRKSPEFYATRDWTDGCIALSNADMVDVWLRTTVGIPIEIRP